MNIQKYHLSLDNETIFNKCKEIHISEKLLPDSKSPILINTIHNFYVLENQPHTWDEFIPLVNLLQTITPVPISHSWFNIMSKGNYVTGHHHPRAQELVGVYYVVYDKTHPPLEFCNNGVWTPINLIPGDCIIFPRDLHHRVGIQENDNIRCSIAFNM